MANISDNTLRRIEKWLYNGTSLEAAFPKPDQQYRVRLCYEFYLRWLQNKDASPRTICTNIARRDYQAFFAKAAHGDEQAQQMVIALHISVDDEGNIRPRTPAEIANDIALCNHIIRYFMERDDSQMRHKAMVLDNAEWLQREGKKQNNDRAVGKGIDVMMKIYDDFKDKDDVQGEMPDMSHISITQDVSIVKRDRINYTDEEKQKMMRKYGLTQKDMHDIEEETLARPEPEYVEYMEEEAQDPLTPQGGTLDTPDDRDN